MQACHIISLLSFNFTEEHTISRSKQHISTEASNTFRQKQATHFSRSKQHVSAEVSNTFQQKQVTRFSRSKQHVSAEASNTFQQKQATRFSRSQRHISAEASNTFQQKSATHFSRSKQHISTEVSSQSSKAVPSRTKTWRRPLMANIMQSQAAHQQLHVHAVPSRTKKTGADL